MFNIKFYYIILSILNSTEKEPISSKFLSAKLSLSDKTIQNNIPQLNELCNKNGFEIVSKSGNGFYSLVHDPIKAYHYKQLLTIYFSKNYLTQTSDALQIAAFTMYILGKNIPVSIVELADFFSFSKSTIYSYLTKASSNLEHTSGIQLVNDSNGVYCISSEFQKRYYISYALASETFLYDLKALFGYDFHYFASDEYKTRKVTNILNKYGFSVNDERFSRLLIYISYSHFRFVQKYNLQEDPKIIYDKLTNLREMVIAKELCKALSLPFIDDTNELAHLAAMLLLSNDKPSDINETSYGKEFSEGIKDCEHVINEFISDFSRELCTTVNYRKSLCVLSYIIYFHHMFGLLQYNYSSIPANFSQSPNALIRHLARLITNRISNYFKEYISHRIANYVCEFCANLLFSYQIEKQDMKLLLILQKGDDFDDYIRKWLFAHLQPKPYSINTSSLYMANYLNLADYDLILTDYPSLGTIQNQYKTYEISTPIDNDPSFVKEYYRICSGNGLDAKQLASQFSHIAIFEDCDIKNTDSFLTAVDNELDGLGSIPIRELRKLSRPVNYYADNKTLLVPYLYKNADQHENILYVYFNKNKEKSKYEVLVFMCLYSDNSLISLKNILNMCNVFVENPSIFKDLKQYI